MSTILYIYLIIVRGWRHSFRTLTEEGGGTEIECSCLALDSSQLSQNYFQNQKSPLTLSCFHTFLNNPKSLFFFIYSKCFFFIILVSLIAVNLRLLWFFFAANCNSRSAIFKTLHLSLTKINYYSEILGGGEFGVWGDIPGLPPSFHI